MTLLSGMVNALQSPSPKWMDYRLAVQRWLPPPVAPGQRSHGRSRHRCALLHYSNTLFWIIAVQSLFAVQYPFHISWLSRWCWTALSKKSKPCWCRLPWENLLKASLMRLLLCLSASFASCRREFEAAQLMSMLPVLVFSLKACNRTFSCQ